MYRFLLYFLLLMLFGAYSSDVSNTESQPSTSIETDTTVVDFWNGNRSLIRQKYERQVLEAILTATEPDDGPWEINESIVEYPGAEEATVFNEKEHHLFVTIAGNQKFTEDDMIMIPKPLTKNLLGYRIPIIREKDVRKFNSINTAADIQKLTHGIPSDWSDATIFRHNGYSVEEDGTFDDIFERLASGRFDYSAYGANEVLGVYENRASKQDGLAIDDNVILFYPFPLVFYVHPNMPDLAERIDRGLQLLIESGTLDTIFNQYYSNIVEELSLDQRKLFILHNPLIPEEFADLKPDLSNL
ncbi:MAG: transporter substrate-binding domain-containing protein [Fodinibius sp.]|nr:transporter substrate-binding domain-containing protein [Fodinibius sp.]